MHEWNWESLRRPPSLHFSPLNLSIQTMKDIIVILITTSTVNCFLSVPWVQPLPQISPQPEGCLFKSFIMLFYANSNIFLESQLKKALIATVTSRMKPRECIYRITKQGKVLPALHLPPHGVWKSQKKSHSKLRGKRATFTFWVDKS